MRNFLIYTIVFILLILMQVFLFDNLNISVYLSPLVYVGFIILLPMNMKPVAILGLGLLTGIVMDILSGLGGLHTIATLATAFLRPLAVNITIGKDMARDGGIPVPLNVGAGTWLQYAALLVGVHCVVFFLFEALTFHYFGFTLLRIIVSALATLLVIWFFAALFPTGGGKAVRKIS